MLVSLSRRDALVRKEVISAIISTQAVYPETLKVPAGFKKKCNSQGIVSIVAGIAFHKLT